MIPFIQKYLVDYCDETDEIISSGNVEPKKVGQKVAIIGSGPSGLAAADFLNKCLSDRHRTLSHLSDVHRFPAKSF